MAEKRAGASVAVSEQPGMPGAPSKRLRCVACSPIENLPLDILKLIFRYFPFRALLRSIALVCKRFRTAALNSVEYICFDRTLKCNRLDLFLYLFPSLTSLEVRRRSEHPVLLPRTLRRLCVELDIHQDSMNIISTVPLPSLVLLLPFASFTVLINYCYYVATSPMT